MSQDFDCTTCGVCCDPPENTSITIPIEDDDQVPLTWSLHVEQSKTGEAWITFDKDTDLESCPHLCGETGKQVECEIYDRRPKVCRDFPPGSDTCLIMRSKAGLPLKV